MGLDFYTAILWGATVKVDNYPDDILEQWEDSDLLISYECGNYLGFMLADSDEQSFKQSLPKRFCFYKKAFNLADLETHINQTNSSLLLEVRAKWNLFQSDLKRLNFELPDAQYIVVPRYIYCDWD